MRENSFSPPREAHGCGGGGKIFNEDGDLFVAAIPVYEEAVRQLLADPPNRGVNMPERRVGESDGPHVTDLEPEVHLPPDRPSLITNG